MSNLQAKAMLITLSISCWTARKLDRKVGAEVEASHNARDAGRYNKLLVDKQYLDPLTSFSGKVRAYHYKMTMPWNDSGARLLPSKLFMEYSAEIRKFKQEYANLVSTFVDLYRTTLVQDARQRLGTMYEADDYPEASELFGKFSIDLDIASVPDGQDFRVDVGQAEADAIRRDMSAKVAERTAAAQRDAWLRVRESLDSIILRLTAPKARIYDSLIDNARELARLLPGLNVQDDPVMQSVADQLSELVVVSSDRLRMSARARTETAEKARKIMEMVP